MNQYIGIIDLGSNSARLVIYYFDNGAFYPFDNYKEVLRLSNHIQVDGRIDDNGFNKTIDCIVGFKRICDNRQVVDIYAVATAAIRQATNGSDLLTEIQNNTGISFKVLSGEEEANYGYLAIVNSMNINNAISVDIGGGSTEVTLIKDRKNIKRVSFPFGAVNLTKNFLKQDIPEPKEINDLIQYLIENFGSVDWLKDASLPLIGIGGTARNIAKMHQQKIQYPLNSVHGYEIDKDEIDQLIESILPLNINQRKKLQGLSKDRADIIVAGMVLFFNLMKYTNSSQLIISNKGVRDGILYERILVEKGLQILEDNTLYSVEQMLIRYQVNRDHAYHVASLATSILSDMENLSLISVAKQNKKVLYIASLLHDIGRSINFYDTSKHTFYLLTNVLITGLTHRERTLIAFIASFKTGKQLKQGFNHYRAILMEEDHLLIQQLGVILLLARTLDRSMVQQVELVKVKKGKEELIIEGYGKKDLVEFSMAKELMKKFKKIYGIPFTFTTNNDKSRIER